MLRPASVRIGRTLISLGVCVIAFTLVAPGPATASDRSIFKTTKTYVLKSTPHQDAFFQKFNGAGDYAGALAEATFITDNTVAAKAALNKQKASSNDGTKGKRILLKYWTVKKEAAQWLIRACAVAGLAGDLPTAQAHLDEYRTVASKATKLLVRGVAFVK